MPAPQPASATIALRSPDEVMRLARLGSFHQTRLSFLRALLRDLGGGAWTFDRPIFDIDARGVGVAVYAARGRERTYSLICFSHDLAPEKRTDRVIAEEWDATFALFDGIPSPADIERLSQNVPRQEAGRCLESEIVLARANRSVRLFDHVVESLAGGRQPDADALEATGYLMRTTAVYGNGKFGIADRGRLADRPELAGPFRAEMLSVWLIRAFTVDLADHLAALKAPKNAVKLDHALRRRLGVGNATGLGMAPFLVRHPSLFDRWIAARETALARVRALATAGGDQVASFQSALRKSHRLVAGWLTDDPVQKPRIEVLRKNLRAIEAHVSGEAWRVPTPWDALYRWGEANLSPEGQEYLVTLLIEPHGSLVDDLADAMAADEAVEHAIDGSMAPDALKALVRQHYAWALDTDFARKEAQARFWYVSEEKLEPRLGERWQEDGAEKEQPLSAARDVKALAEALSVAREPTVAEFLLRHPEHRHATRRVQVAARHPYGEIRDNLLDATMRPIDMLRCKLAFFGCTRFDPRSDRWLRITMFQGAPYPTDPLPWADDWIYGA